MTEQEVFDRLLPLVQEVTGARAERISMRSGMMEDLGAESLDLLDFTFLIEEEFGVTIGAKEFERRASSDLPEGVVYEKNGLLTEAAIVELRKALPEVPPEKLQPGMPKITLPRVLTVGVFVHVIESKLAELDEAA